VLAISRVDMVNGFGLLQDSQTIANLQGFQEQFTRIISELLSQKQIVQNVSADAFFNAHAVFVCFC